ncbi:MAG: ABC transporter permease [Gammaproteobacteria bacterium]
MSRARLAFLSEAGAELLKAVRAPEFLLPTLLMPVAFYSLFAIVLPGSRANAAYLLATFGVFAVMGPAIFGFGVAVATERERGWLDIKRASPASGLAYIGAKLAATVVFASLALVLIYAIAGFVGGVAMPRSVWASLLVVHLVGAVPFALIGLTLGFSLNANGAIAVTNVIFLALAALGGLWIPMVVMPPTMQTFAQFLPSYHMAELALAVANTAGDRPVWFHVSVISVMTALLTASALWAWRRQNG